MAADKANLLDEVDQQILLNGEKFGQWVTGGRHTAATFGAPRSKNPRKRESRHRAEVDDGFLRITSSRGTAAGSIEAKP